MDNKILLLILTLCFCTACHSQETHNYTENEQRCINVFYDFTDYLNTGLKARADITDSSRLKYILVKYLFVDKSIDTNDLKHFHSNELNSIEFNNLKRDISTFNMFLQERQKDSVIENLTLLPLRLSKDTFIFNKLTNFQKENSFALYDKRSPGSTIAYVLFVPEIKDMIFKPKVWSWTLTFRFGKYFFKSAIGEEGHEYLFEK